MFTVGANASGQPAVTLRTGKKPVTVKKDRVAVTLSCPATATSGCAGVLGLATARKVRRSGRKKGPKTNLAVTKPASSSIPAGKTATVKIKISGKGGAYVARRGTTTLLVSVGGTPIGKIKVPR